MTAQGAFHHSLIAHQSFVRELARSLVRDDTLADDVAQETWLESLKRGPSSIDSVRGWLARVTRSKALDLVRSETRRAHRERTVSRPEADDSETALRERVALAQRVVAAVLSLREPYRGTLLLRYYENLTPGEIAKRRDVPPGTVRAQLSRALQLLREKLERDFDGDRMACTAALAELASTASSAAAPLATAAAIGLGATLVVVVGIVILASGSRESRTDDQLMAAVPNSSATESDAAPTPELGRSAVDAREAVGNEPSQPATVEQERDLSALSIAELDDLAVRIQALLRERWLTVPSRFAALERGPDRGVARILDRVWNGNFESGLVGLRGGGAYFSFATGSHDFDDQPTLELQRGRYRSGIYGNATGFAFDLGAFGLDSLPRDGATPSGLDATLVERYRFLAAEVRTTDREVDQEYQRRGSELELDRGCGALAGSTYLVRSISTGGHDVLAAFTCLERDSRGDTIAWRVLRRTPVPGEYRRPPRPQATVQPPEPWLAALGDDALVDLLTNLRKLATERLFAVPAAIVERARGFPVAHLLRAESCERLVDSRGGGAFYSFATKDHSYDREPDVMLNSGMFTSQFYGASLGMVLDVGTIPLEHMTTHGASPPSGLEDAQNEGWRFIWSIETSPSNPDRPSEKLVSTADRNRADELRLRTAAVMVGDTYLLRSILPGEHDHIVAFTVVAEDEHGLFIAWHVLKTFDS